MMVRKERMHQIGKLIGVYREERRNKSQNAFSQKHFCENICSPNTLKAIEKGKISRSIDIYTGLLGKFNLKLNEYPEVDNAIDRLMDPLYQAMEFFSCEKVDHLTRKMLTLLQHFKACIYYSELYEIFEDLNKYYLYDEDISVAKAFRYKQLIAFSPSNIHDVLRVLVFGALHTEYYADQKYFAKIIDEIGLVQSKLPMVKIGLIYFYFTQNKYMRMKGLIVELEAAFIKEHNKTRLLDIYKCLIAMLGEIDFEMCHTYITKALQLIENEKFADYKIGELYSNIACSYHRNNNYKIAVDAFNCMKKYKKFLLSDFIFLADCLNHLEIAMDETDISEYDLKHCPNNYRYMYHYYTFDKDIPVFARENYILKRILPTLRDERFIKIFRYELVKLVEESTRYRNIHIFEAQVKNNLLELC